MTENLNKQLDQGRFEDRMSPELVRMLVQAINDPRLKDEDDPEYLVFEVNNEQRTLIPKRHKIPVEGKQININEYIIGLIEKIDN